MIRLIVIAVLMFGLYMLLGRFVPSVFSTGFVIPKTQQYVSYLTAIMVVAGLFALTRVAVK